jgi:hypothetical protein
VIYARKRDPGSIYFSAAKSMRQLRKLRPGPEDAGAAAENLTTQKGPAQKRGGPRSTPTVLSTLRRCAGTFVTLYFLCEPSETRGWTAAKIDFLHMTVRIFIMDLPPFECAASPFGDVVE